jgi:putative ABC transport system permease protein
MNPAVDPIPLQRLAILFVPVLIVVVIQIRWALSARSSIYAIGRMLLQLLLIGYVLVFLFESERAILVTLVLTIMITVSSWIALRPISSARRHLYPVTVAAITVSGLPTLFVATEWVLDVTPWYTPRIVIPLAGMVFANAMNSVSIAAERYSSELSAGLGHSDARKKAFDAALIPLVNSLLAVGLVALPGMMTGQVLAGVSPLIAARYQILVMCMLFGSSGIAAACYLYWSRPPSKP